MTFWRLLVDLSVCDFIVLTNCHIKGLSRNINTNKCIHCFTLKHKFGIMVTGFPDLALYFSRPCNTKSLLVLHDTLRGENKAGSLSTNEVRILLQGAHGFPSKQSNTNKYSMFGIIQKALRSEERRVGKERSTR